MVQGHQGAARPLGAAQTGLVREGGIPSRPWQGGHGLPCTQLRDALQRAPVSEPQMLPVPDQDDEGAHEATEQLEHAVPRAYRAEGDTGQGNGGEVHRGGGTVRPHPERFGACEAAPPDGRRDNRHGDAGGHRGQIPCPVTGKPGLSGGHGNVGKGNARRGQAAVPAHALRHGRPPRIGGNGLPLRASLHRPERLPPVVRRTAGLAATVQPYLQPIHLHRQQRRGTATLREERT